MNARLSTPLTRTAFAPLCPPWPARSASRRAITADTRRPEPELLPALLEQARPSPAQAEATRELALRLAEGLRQRAAQPRGGDFKQGLVQALLQEFSLTSQEGIALMCLAEALLRIPDDATRDALIRDKVGAGRWAEHLGGGRSMFVNAAAWGLLITGKLIATHSEQGLGGALQRLTARGGEPLVRRAMDMAMRLMGEQFVSGQDIQEALQRARAVQARGFRHSFDMLGEAALTAADAQRCLRAYTQAIDAIGAAAGGRGVIDGPGISIKLSALHPRYSVAQTQRVMDELYPRLRDLALQAARHDIGLAIDAEEADRLELSLDLLERLCADPQLAGWQGLGFVVQAYQKRAPALLRHLIGLAQQHHRRLMVRLVKGAYWDSEIKRAQVDGLADYPVYTRKAHTDVAYLACARLLLEASQAIYPQFATHNAQTLAAIVQMADPQRWAPGQYEFQCLHGMGEPLYDAVVSGQAPGGLRRPCRIYAPVGSHETLLAYLVRRLLENGANSSFVHRIADAHLSLEALVEDPVALVERLATPPAPAGTPHPAIPLPAALYGSRRRNSAGQDLACETTLARLQAELAAAAAQTWQAAPLLARPPQRAADGALPDAVAPHATQPVVNPADPLDVIGSVRPAAAAEVDAALQAATEFAPIWAATPAVQRASALEAAADALEADPAPLLQLLVREAGKTLANAQAELREAVDFLRFYAAQLRQGWTEQTTEPLGVVVAISPWNFPLAIFLGQIAAALAAGNVVLAKPAEQTPLVATEAVRRLLAAGLHPGTLQLLTGAGETVGAALVADARVQGVLFTGSTEVARRLQRQLAGRLNADGQPVTLVAETGGQNAMIVDSSALPEQVVADVLASAFDSAGQRCSALRVLCVQEDIADGLLAMLHGAMAELRLGPTDRLSTDIGPVIDAAARESIEAHVQRMAALGRRVFRPPQLLAQVQGLPGHFVAPTLIEIERLSDLQREVFGPVLHLLRWKQGELPALLAQIHASGYGLTLGLHTRIDETIATVERQARVGNVYVNRNMVGAVVGVQPFGGEGLSGTGPKAGGPLQLWRLLRRAPADALQRALDFAGTPLDATGASVTAPRRLAGPTGERNTWRLRLRERLLCLAEAEDDRTALLEWLLARGARPLLPNAQADWLQAQPLPLRNGCALWDGHTPVDLVLHQGSADDRLATLQDWARCDGPALPIVPVITRAPGERDWPAERLYAEHSLSWNTAAAGGNASLMSLGVV